MNSSCPESSVTIPVQNRAMQRELVDSEEGKNHIQANWRKLMYCTEVNKTVLTQLFGCNIITKEEENKLGQMAASNKLEATSYLFELIVTRRNGYAAVADALLDAQQTKAYEILSLMLPLNRIRPCPNSMATKQPEPSGCTISYQENNHSEVDIGNGWQTIPNRVIEPMTECVPLVASNRTAPNRKLWYFDWMLEKPKLISLLICIAMLCCAGFFIKPRYLVNHFLLIKIVFLLIFVTLVGILCLHVANMRR